MHFWLSGHFIGSWMQDFPSGQSFKGKVGHDPSHLTTISKQFSVLGSQGFQTGKQTDDSGHISGNLMHY